MDHVVGTYLAEYVMRKLRVGLLTRVRTVVGSYYYIFNRFLK